MVEQKNNNQQSNTSNNATANEKELKLDIADDKTELDLPFEEEETTLLSDSNHDISPESTDSQHSTEISFNEDATQITSGAVLRNRFDLLEVIGQGGMGTVYKAVDQRDIEAGNSKFIAIKVLKDEFRTDRNLLKALHAETRKTQSLAHPNIVTVYDFDRDENSAFMTMEYIDGIPLSQMIKSEPTGLAVDEALHIASQVASALIFAHSQHIIHLDLKPSNIFVTPNKHVKVFDFGIAQVSNIFHTKGFNAGILGGLTPSYASLEMFNKETPDQRDDIYALACITYELLAGFHPYNRERADIALERKLVPQKIKSLNATQWKALSQALQLKRKDRIATVELFLQGMGTQKSNKSPLFAAIGLVAILPIAYLSYSLFTQPKKEVLDNEPIITEKVDEISPETRPLSKKDSPTKKIIDKKNDEIIEQKTDEEVDDALVKKEVLDKVLNQSPAIDAVTTKIPTAAIETEALAEEVVLTNKETLVPKLSGSEDKVSQETVKKEVLDQILSQIPVIDAITLNVPNDEMKSESKNESVQTPTVKPLNAKISTEAIPKVIAKEAIQATLKEVIEKEQAKTAPITIKKQEPNKSKNQLKTTIESANNKFNNEIIIASNVIEDDIVTVDLEGKKGAKTAVPILTKHLVLSPNKKVYKIGDLFTLEFMVAKPSFMTIVIINSLGEATTLFPNPYQTDNYSKPNESYQIPPYNADFDINIEGPAGKDSIIAIMSSQAIDPQILSKFKQLDKIKQYLKQQGLKFKHITYKIIK